MKKGTCGFVQVPIIIGVAIAAVVLAGGYFGIKSYVDSEIQNANSSKENEFLKKEIDSLKSKQAQEAQQVTSSSQSNQQNPLGTQKPAQETSKVVAAQKISAPEIPAQIVPKTSDANPVCKKLIEEHEIFIKNIDDCITQYNDLEEGYIKLIRAPSGLSSYNYFNFIYEQLSGGKDLYEKNLVRLEQSIQKFSLTTFGTNQPSIFRQIFQKWIDTRGSVMNSMLLSFKILVDNPMSTQYLMASEVTHEQAYTTDKNARKEFYDSYTSAFSNFEKKYREAFPVLGCPWVTPGTDHSPDIVFGGSFGESVNGNHQAFLSGSAEFNSAVRLYWDVQHSEECTAKISGLFGDNKWVGSKQSSGSQVIYQSKPTTSEYILSCSNSFGTNQKVVKIETK